MLANWGTLVSLLYQGHRSDGKGSISILVSTLANNGDKDNCCFSFQLITRGFLGSQVVSSSLTQDVRRGLRTQEAFASCRRIMPGALMCLFCIQKAWVAMLSLCSSGVINYIIATWERSMGLEFIRITSVWKAQHVARKSPLTGL